MESDILAYQTSAQDAASSLILLCDGALRRLHTEQVTDVSFAQAGSPEMNVRECGETAWNGVTFSAAIWALANQTRHIDRWRTYTEEVLAKNEDFSVLARLDLTPLDDDVSFQFLILLGLTAYRAFEDRLVSIGTDLMYRRYGGSKILTVRLLKSHMIVLVNEPGSTKSTV